MAASKQFTKVKNKNNIAAADLNKALNADGMVDPIHAPMNSNWPNGLACCIIDMLHNCFVPQNRISHVEMQQALNALVMQHDEDPARLFVALESDWNQYSTPTFAIEEEDLIAMVLDKALINYGMVLTCEIHTQGTNLTFVHLHKAMSQLW